MNESKTESKKHWQKSPVPNLVRFVASGVYFARIRVKGKLIRRSLKTKALAGNQGAGGSKITLGRFGKERATNGRTFPGL